MTVVFATGSVATGTGTGNLSAQTTGFTSQAILFGLRANGTTGDSTTADAAVGWGFASSTTTSEQYSAFFFDDDNSPTTTSTRYATNVGAACSCTNSLDPDGLLTVSAIDTTTFTPTVGDAFATSGALTWLAIGGITDAYVDMFDMPTTGTLDVTTPGFEPDLVLFIGNSEAESVLPKRSYSAIISFGVGISASEQACFITNSQHNQADSVCKSLTNNTICSGHASNGGASISQSIKYNGTVTGGFQVEKVDGAANQSVGFIAIKGIGAKLIQTATINSTGTTDLSCGTLTPEAAIVFGSGASAAVNETSGVAGSQGNLGFAVKNGTGADVYSVFFMAEDAKTSSDSMSRNSTTRAYTRFNPDDLTSELGSADVTSFQQTASNELRLTSVVADGGASNPFYVLALGQPVVAGSSNRRRTGVFYPRGLARGLR